MMHDQPCRVNLHGREWEKHRRRATSELDGSKNLGRDRHSLRLLSSNNNIRWIASDALCFCDRLQAEEARLVRGHASPWSCKAVEASYELRGESTLSSHADLKCRQPSTSSLRLIPLLHPCFTSSTLPSLALLHEDAISLEPCFGPLSKHKLAQTRQRWHQ